MEIDQRPEIVRPDRSTVLTINGGSSSLKFALFARDGTHKRLLSGKFERVGTPEARMSVKGPAVAGGREEHPVQMDDHEGAAGLLIDWIKHQVGFAAVAAVGHRFVHGGAKHSRPERVTPELLDDLRRFSPFDPDHMPAEIALVEAFRQVDPDLPQVACFDTAFHHDLPRVAKILPIPRRYEAAGVHRYGFHGLSYEYLMGELGRIGEAGGRVVLAHLGSGASLAAVLDGKPVDTSMAFTPTAGLVMGTRTGDLDPGLVAYLARTEGMSADRFQKIVNKESGLLGVSETSADLRDLIARQGQDVRAAEAVSLFCYSVKKWLGAFAAALGGLDTLVFSGGIGENSAEVRARVCDGLGFLGVSVDPARNAETAPLISPDGTPVKIRVIPTDEELTIARAVMAVLDAPV